MTDEEKAQCACHGMRHYHTRRGEPACELVKLHERRRERTRGRCWTTGSPIQIPDTDYIL